MRRRLIPPIVIASAYLGSAVSAALIVDAPQPITRRVTVQLIQTALDNGTTLATVFGNATQRATIESSIDLIWAQAGIDVDVLPPINRYNNTFAYQGNAGTGTRPATDLTTIFSNAARASSVLNADTKVLNFFFVNVVPGFAPLNEWTSAGYANIGAAGYTNAIGATLFDGDNLFSTADNLDVIAKTMAHEIGHNLGLVHLAGGLMDGNNQPNQKLTSVQVSTARSLRYAQAFTTPITGDYNANGRVDAADYILWRNMTNLTGSGLAADGNGSGSVDAIDLTIWRGHFSNVLGTAGAGADTQVAAVPEPNAADLAMVIVLVTMLTPRHPSARFQLGR